MSAGVGRGDCIYIISSVIKVKSYISIRLRIGLRLYSVLYRLPVKVSRSQVSW